MPRRVVIADPHNEDCVRMRSAMAVGTILTDRRREDQARSAFAAASSFASKRLACMSEPCASRAV